MARGQEPDRQLSTWRVFPRLFFRTWCVVRRVVCCRSPSLTQCVSVQGLGATAHAEFACQAVFGACGVRGAVLAAVFAMRGCLCKRMLHGNAWFCFICACKSFSPRRPLTSAKICSILLHSAFLAVAEMETEPARKTQRGDPAPGDQVSFGLKLARFADDEYEPARAEQCSQRGAAEARPRVDH